MKAVKSKYGSVTERLAAPRTRAQALRLKGVAKEAYQAEQYAVGLSFDEAARRIDTLKAEIDQAILFRDVGEGRDYFVLRPSARSTRLRLLPTFLTAFFTVADERRFFFAS